MEKQKKIFDSYESKEFKEDVKVIKHVFTTPVGLMQEIVIQKRKLIPAR